MTHPLFLASDSWVVPVASLAPWPQSGTTSPLHFLRHSIAASPAAASSRSFASVWRRFAPPIPLAALPPLLHSTTAFRPYPRLHHRSPFCLSRRASSSGGHRPKRRCIATKAKATVQQGHRPTIELGFIALKAMHLLHRLTLDPTMKLCDLPEAREKLLEAAMHM